MIEYYPYNTLGKHPYCLTILFMSENHQSSSAPPPLPLLCILACLALKASASPPAKLPPPAFPSLFGVCLPFSLPMLTALSLGAGAGIGCLPFSPVGRLLGGAGGVGFCLVVVIIPLEGKPFKEGDVDCVEVGRGTGRGAIGGGGGGAVDAFVR